MTALPRRVVRRYTRLSARRLALTATVALLVAAAATACGGRRERLDVPVVTLDVADQTPAPAGRIKGHVSATDASGLTLLAVYACTADSVFRQGEDLDRPRAAGFDFSLYVASTATPGAPVEVYAVAGDDQGFYADTSRTLAVGGTAAARASVGANTTSTSTARGTAGADAAVLCPHVIRARRARSDAAIGDAPTAPRP